MQNYYSSAGVDTILYYAAGYVSRKMTKLLLCAKCRQSLSVIAPSRQEAMLMLCRTQGGVTHPNSQLQEMLRCAVNFFFKECERLRCVLGHHWTCSRQSPAEPSHATSTRMRLLKDTASSTSICAWYNTASAMQGDSVKCESVTKEKSYRGCVQTECEKYYAHLCKNFHMCIQMFLSYD